MTEQQPIRFRRGADVTKALRELIVETFDDPRYRYWQGSDWMELPKENESPGWSEEMVEVECAGRSVGFVSWGLSRTHQKVDNLSILLRPAFLGSGVGVRVLAFWLSYALVERRFRKVEFTCFAENRAALRIYERALGVGARLVGTRREAALLRDGRFHDLILFEILRDDFIPDALFRRLLGGAGGWRLDLAHSERSER
jgi:RimJ/RimL family protein N-acetyltransferase